MAVGHAAFLDARSRSAGESISRVTSHWIGPPPSHLHEVVHDRRLVGRTNFCWEEQRTLGESDGRVKHRVVADSERDLLWAEKWREDALDDLSWQMVRWRTADLQREHLLAPRARGRGRSSENRPQQRGPGAVVRTGRSVARASPQLVAVSFGRDACERSSGDYGGRRCDDAS